jgi:hypothetical protein
VAEVQRDSANHDENSRRPEPAERAERPQEGFLRDVARVFLAAERAVGQREIGRSTA